MSLKNLETLAPLDEGSAIRDALDPDGRLPQVILTKDADHSPYDVLGREGEPTYAFHIVDARTGSRVGRMALAESQESGAYLISDIEVDQSGQGQGYGMAAHALAIEAAAEAGRGFVNDRKLTVDSLRVWKRLIDAEIAVLVRPFVGDDPSLPDDQQYYYTGEAVIDPSYL